MNNDYFKYEHIDSVKYRNKIQELVHSFDLIKKTQITNFCVCICFRDNKKYFLSNMPDWAIEYHKIGGTRSDEVFELELMKNKNYFIPRCSNYDVVQNSLVVREELEYGYFDTYSLIRRHVDCTFILLALHKTAVVDNEKIYESTRDDFENFCIFFIQNMLSEIKEKNKEHRSLQILNDPKLIAKVIKQGIIRQIPKMTERELECIKLIKNNYPPKLIARTMSISEKTVRNYIDAIREKLGCSSTLDILEKAIQYDL